MIEHVSTENRLRAKNPLSGNYNKLIMIGGPGNKLVLFARKTGSKYDILTVRIM